MHPHSSPIPLDGTQPLTVEDAMLRRPTVHLADVSVAEARAAFDSSKKTHLLLLTRNGLLISTVTRADLEKEANPELPATTVGTLLNRTVSPDTPLDHARHDMLRRGERRLAVVDDAMHLLGLLCLKRSHTGFCTDEGVAAMRRERPRDDPAPREGD